MGSQRVSHGVTTKQQPYIFNYETRRLQCYADARGADGLRRRGCWDHSALCGSHMLYLKINVTDVLFSSINCKYNK